MAGVSGVNTDVGSIGLSLGSCVYQPLRPKLSHSTSYPFAILIQVKSDCGMPFFCSSKGGLWVGSISVVDCSLGATRSLASACHPLLCNRLMIPTKQTTGQWYRNLSLIHISELTRLLS